MSEPYQRIKTIMENENLAKAIDLAREIGCDASTITKIKKHGRGIGFELATAISARYGYKIKWLRDGIGEMFGEKKARTEAAAGEIIDPEIEGSPNPSGETITKVESTPEQGQALRMLLDIFESGDQKAVEAIYKNLEYFSSAARRGAADRRKNTDTNWPPEKERRQGGAGPKAPQG